MTTPQTLAERFESAYDFLYNRDPYRTPGETEEEHAATAWFDVRNGHKETALRFPVFHRYLSDLAQERQDFITSDREAAAFESAFRSEIEAREAAAATYADMPKFYETPEKHLAVVAANPNRKTGAATPGYGYMVVFSHGSEIIPDRPASIPHSHAATAQHPRLTHPAAIGQEPRHLAAGSAFFSFRTKTAARKYVNAVSAAGILPADRPATRAEVDALRDWLTAASADANPAGHTNTANTAKEN